MRFFVLSLTLLLTSCVMTTTTNGNYTETVTSWRWANATSLVQNWGKPSRIAQLPNGNLVYIYHKESYRNYPGQPVTTPYTAVSVAGGRNVVIAPAVNQQAAPGSTYLLQCTTMFEVDPHNIIVDVRASGNNCTGDNGFMLSRANPHPLAQAPKKQ